MLKREIKINLKSLLIWLSILVFLFLIVFLIYPSIINGENSEMITDMMKMFSKKMLEMFNMDIANINSVFGWFKTEGYIFILLISSLYASILGISILSKEEANKTIEFLYSKPVTRNEIVTSKIVCGLINITSMFILVTLFNLIGMWLSNDLQIKQFLLLSFAPLLTMYPVFFISMLIATVLKKPKKTYGIGIGIVLISYFLQTIGNMSDKVEFIKYFSLFELTPARTIILNNSFSINYILISLLICIASIYAIYKLYNKKEFL